MGTACYVWIGLYGAAVGTAWWLLGSPRNGQAALYLLHKHLRTGCWVGLCIHSLSRRTFLKRADNAWWRVLLSTRLFHPSAKALVWGHSLARIVGSNPARVDGCLVSCDCCAWSGRGLWEGPIIRPEESYRVWCVVMWCRNLKKMRRPWTALGPGATEKKKLKLLHC